MNEPRHVFLGVPGRETPFTTISKQVLPVAILQTLAQGFLSERIHSRSLFRGLRLQCGREIVRDVEVVLGRQRYQNQRSLQPSPCFSAVDASGTIETPTLRTACNSDKEVRYRIFKG
jgi:hypothetical protein